MHSLRPAFFKSAPTSRAARIYKSLRYPGRTPPGTPPMATRLILREILRLLTKKTDTLESRFDELLALLNKLPAWTEWTKHEDAVIGSTLNEFGVSKNETGRNMDDIQESMLAQELIRENGNVAYLMQKDLQPSHSSGRFLFLYTQWLHHRSSPKDPDCHVQDDQGQWLDDDTLRRRLRDGWRLHIPTRSLHIVFSSMSNQQTQALHQSSVGRRSSALTSLRDEIREAQMRESIKHEQSPSSGTKK